MQPPHARAQLALRQAARKARIQNKKIAHDRLIIYQARRALKSGVVREKKKEARRARWEDWYLGPLRPRRGTELKAMEEEVEGGERGGRKRDEEEMLPRFGNTRRERVREEKRMRQKLPAPPPRKPRSFREGDRVVCVAEKGTTLPDRGKIGVVVQVNKMDRECIVGGWNLGPARLPRFTAITEGTARQTEIGLIPKPISFSDLKPVVTLTNPVTKEKEDIIIGLTPEQKSEAGSPNLIPELLSSEPDTRPLPASPYSTIKEDKPKEKRVHTAPTYEIDTLRFEVEARTWTPTLLRAPLPGTVIDELRNKYSAFRTRHEDEYIRKKAAQEKEKRAYEVWAKSGGSMLKSPLAELSMKAKADAKKMGKEEVLSENLLEVIGRRMAEKGVKETFEEKERGKRMAKWNKAKEYWPEQIGITRKGPNKGGRRPEGSVPFELLDRDNSDEELGAR